MSISSASILMRDSEPMSTIVDDNIVLLSVREGSYFELNAVGSSIWKMLDRSRSVHDIMEALSQEYGADIETVTSDVRPFLQKLIDQRILRIVS